MIENADIINLEVALLRNKLLGTINAAKLPITVKSMIANELYQAIKEKEQDTLRVIMNSLKKGDEADGINTGGSEEETILRTDETISDGQQPIPAGDVQSTEHTQE